MLLTVDVSELKQNDKVICGQVAFNVISSNRGANGFSKHYSVQLIGEGSEYAINMWYPQGTTFFVKRKS